MTRVPRRLAGIGAADLADAAAFDSYTGPSREVTVDYIRGIIALHDGSTAGGLQFLKASSIIATVANRTTLAAIDTTKTTSIYLRESGREGVFLWMTGDYSAQIAADTAQGIYVKATAIAATAGAWVRVYNAFVNVDWFGAVGNSTGPGLGTDDRAAVQAAINVANSFGATVLFSAKKYRIGSPGVTISNTSGGSPDTKRCSLMGSGVRGTYLYGDSGDYKIVSALGEPSNGGSFSMQTVQGMTIAKADNLGTCLYLENHFHAAVRDVKTNGAFWGVSLSDVHETTFDNCVITWARRGLYAQKGTFTQPNVINLFNCTVGNNAEFGIDLLNPAEFNMWGGSIEANGQPADVAIGSRWGIRASYTVAAVEGSVGLNLNGVYLETNSGTADIFVQEFNVTPIVVNIKGCTFQRNSGTYFTTNNILFSWSGTTYKHVVNVIGNGHRSFNDYVANAGRPYINLAGPAGASNMEFNDFGCYYHDAVEKADIGANLPGQGRDFMLSAMGEVSSAGVLSNGRNTASASRTATGTYQVTYNKPLSVAAIPALSPVGVGGAVCPDITALSTTGFTVVWRNTSGVAIDTRFGFSTQGGLRA